LQSEIRMQQSRRHKGREQQVPDTLKMVGNSLFANQATSRQLLTNSKRMLPCADTYPPATARTLERHKHKQFPLANTTVTVIVTNNSSKHCHHLPTTSLAYLLCLHLLQNWMAT